MTTPAPAPEAGHSPFAHIEQWVAEHLGPDIADIRIKAENAAADAAKALAYFQAHAANAEAVAGLAVKIVGAADPAAAPALAVLIPEAEQVLAEAKRIAEEFTGSQM